MHFKNFGFPPFNAGPQTPEDAPVLADDFSIGGHIGFGRFASMSFSFHDDFFDGVPGELSWHGNFLNRPVGGRVKLKGGFAALRKYYNQFSRIVKLSTTSPIEAFGAYQDLIKEIVNAQS